MKERSDRDEKEEENIVIYESDLPVDRGYAWVILFAAFMILFLVIGGLKCFGVFYVEVARQYHVSSKEIQLIQSLTGFFYLGLVLSLIRFSNSVVDTASANLLLLLFAGPLANVLALRFSNRFIIFVGGFLCGTGFLLTAFAPSVGYFYVTYGCITGFGYGLSFNPCIISFVNYFQKKRALANGIVTAGGGFGAVVLPLLMRYLIDTMTLEGCMMIFAGFLYNICVFACLLRPHKNYPMKKRVQKKKDLKIYKSENSVDQQSITLLDAGDLIQYDDKSYVSVDDGRSQNSFVSEGESLLRHTRKRSKRGSKLANASIISLKSFNPSLYTNPDNMAKSICSEDQLSVDTTCKYDKQMNASVISLKSFDPSVCSNVDAMGRSVYSDDQQILDTINSLKYENKQLNASVISLKSFDPSMSSNIDALGKSIYSDDQQSIGFASLGDTSRKQSLGVDSIDDSILKESFDKNKFNSSITESQTEEISEEESKSCLSNENTQIGTDQEKINLVSNDVQKPILKSHFQGKRRHPSDGSNSLKAYSTSENQRSSKTDECVSHTSIKAEKESLLKAVAWLKKEDRKHLTASIISLKSFEPSLCASLGVIAGLSMQSIPQHFGGENHIQQRKITESTSIESSNKRFSLKHLLFSMDWSLFRNPVFVLYTIFVFCEGLGYLSLFNILPPYCEEINASDSEGAMIIGIISLSDLIGRLFFGWLNHVCQKQNRIIYFTCCLLMSVGIILTPETKTFAHLAILCSIYGLFTGGYNAVLINVIVNSIGLERFAHAWGFIAFSLALSLLLNPFEAGFIKDTTDSWAPAFRINGYIALFGCTLLPIIGFLERRKANSSQTVEIEMDTSVEL